MAVSDYTDSASLLSDGSGSFTAPPYYNGAWSTGSIQYTHSSGQIQRSSAGWGSFAWGTQYGPDTVAVYDVTQWGECDFVMRGKDMGGSNWDAYDAYYSGSGSWELYRVINATASSALDTASLTPSASDWIGMVAIGSGSSVDIATAQYTAGAWGADFMSATDSTSLRLVNSGYLGAWANGTTMKLDNLYGGDAVASGGGSTVSMSAAVNAVSALAASKMISTRGVSAAVAAATAFQASGMIADKHLAAAAAAASGFQASGMVSEKQLQAAVAAMSSVTASTLSIGGQVSLGAVVNATSGMAASGMIATKGLVAAVAATSGFEAARIASSYKLSAEVAAVSSLIADTLKGIATGELTLTPITDGVLVLTATSDPGGLTLVPYSDPGGLTLTPVT